MTSTRTRNQSTAPWTADPERWPDVAVAAGSPARAAVARAVFGTAVARLPVRVRLPDGTSARRRGTGRPGHAPAPAPRVLPPARRLRPDRVRRVLHGGGLGQHRPDRAAHRVRRARRRPRPALAAAAAQAGRPPPAAGRPADRRGRAAQHRPPLRPVQRPVRAVPRRDHDLLQRPVPRTGRRPRRLGPRGSAAPQDRPAPRPGRGGAGLPGARGRHRLGRAGHPGRPPRRHRAHDHDLPRAAGARRPPGRRGRAGRPGQRGAARLPRRRRPVRRDLLGRDARGGRRALLGRLLRRPRPAPGPGRADRAADDHDGARPDAGHPAHLHLDPEVHLPRRAAPVRHRDRDSLARTTLRITGREDFGAHYAETLRIWRERFGARAAEVARLGFDEVFNRMWTFYLCYSEAGFRAGYIDVSQLTLARTPL